MGKILILKYGKELNFVPYYTYKIATLNAIANFNIGKKSISNYF